MGSSAIVQKLWNYCNVLRDDGMSYGDYPGSSPGQADNEQLMYLLFLKMADERTRPPHNQKSPVPSGFDWLSLLKRTDLDEFVTRYNHKNRHTRKPTWSDKTPTGRWRAYDHNDLIARDKASLDIFWLRDESLEDSDNLPEPSVIAQEIVEDLEAALEQFRGTEKAPGTIGGA